MTAQTVISINVRAIALLANHFGTLEECLATIQTNDELANEFAELWDVSVEDAIQVVDAGLVDIDKLNDAISDYERQCREDSPFA